jgi:hypothetical protein
MKLQTTLQRGAHTTQQHLVSSIRVNQFFDTATPPTYTLLPLVSCQAAETMNIYVATTPLIWQLAGNI